MIDKVLEKVYLKFQLDELDKIKAPFATKFTKDYFDKALNQGLFQHDCKTDDMISFRDLDAPPEPLPTQKTDVRDYMGEIQKQACLEFYPPFIDCYAK